jgi:hypothetical protein
MSITPFLNGHRFDRESRRVLDIALEMVCLALRTGDCDQGVKQAIATKVIALAKTGERNPDILCEEVLKDIRAPTVGRLRSRAVFGPTPLHMRTESGGPSSNDPRRRSRQEALFPNRARTATDAEGVWGS